MESCPMCFLEVPPHNFVRHVAQYHKTAPNFRVECREDGCFATYKNWSSFVKHLSRKHRRGNQDESYLQLAENEEVNEVLVERDGADPALPEGPIPPEGPAVQTQGEDLLRWHASTSIVGLKESSSLPQMTISKVINFVEDLTQETLKIVKDMILTEANEETRSVLVNSIEDVLSRLSNSSLFQEVDTSTKMQSFLKANGMVEPVKHILGRRRVWTKNGRLCWVQDVAYIVPILKNLEFFLNNPAVLHCVDHPKPFDRVYRTVMDGSHYRTHRIFLNDNKALSIIFYYDDVEVTNPLSAKTIKLAMFYFTLSNVFPEYRSTLKVINLVGICTTQNLKRYGAAVVLQNFICGMEMLGRAEGVILKIFGQERKFTGLLNFIAGDTPASGSIEMCDLDLQPTRTENKNAKKLEDLLYASI